MATDAVVGLRQEERREVRDDPFDTGTITLDRAANVKSRVVVHLTTQYL